jgi:MarR family 2-MHQ and catechol resistance regulon transcriptional repressor
MGTHYSGSKKEATALDAYIKLIRATEELKWRINSTLSKYGLTERQFAVMEALHYCGPLFQRDLAEKLQKTGGNITLVIDNLEKQSLVKREKNKNDRRFYSILLTKKGRNLVEKMLPECQNMVVQEMSILSLDEQKELGRICKLLGVKE